MKLKLPPDHAQVKCVDDAIKQGLEHPNAGLPDILVWVIESGTQFSAEGYQHLVGDGGLRARLVEFLDEALIERDRFEEGFEVARHRVRAMRPDSSETEQAVTDFLRVGVCRAAAYVIVRLLEIAIENFDVDGPEAAMVSLGQAFAVAHAFPGAESFEATPTLH